ncbi:hypothetical protein NDU88_003192 [Pleurodeles waltl]|uniref:Uncharacterized protein n=1 Tax=Pleurodeles waltl TaxID=8319 RepID=A0AAV7M2P9_PLEWA|nr:hypothetical protein NDU88_003192 [Pleurodeles waltl]
MLRLEPPRRCEDEPRWNGGLLPRRTVIHSLPHGAATLTPHNYGRAVASSFSTRLFTARFVEWDEWELGESWGSLEWMHALMKGDGTGLARRRVKPEAPEVVHGLDDG